MKRLLVYMLLLLTVLSVSGCGDTSGAKFSAEERERFQGATSAQEILDVLNDILSERANPTAEDLNNAIAESSSSSSSESTSSSSSSESTSSSSSEEDSPLAGREIVGFLSTNLEVN